MPTLCPSRNVRLTLPWYLVAVLGLIFFVANAVVAKVPVLYYPAKTGIKELQPNKFPGKGAKYIWLVQFYKQNCRKCYAMKSAFTRAMATIKKDKVAKGVIRLGAFDCSSKKANKEVCAAHRALDGLPFPHIKLIANGVVYDFSAPQTTATSLLQFAYEHAKLPFQQKKPKANKKPPAPSSSSKTTTKSKKCRKKEGIYHEETGIKNLCKNFFPKPGKHKYHWFVKFYSPYDGGSRHVKYNFWDKVSKRDIVTTNKDKLKFGAVDCLSGTANRQLCRAHGVKKFPTLMAFAPDKGTETATFEGEYNWAQLDAWIKSVIDG